MVFSGGGFHGTPPLCTNGSAGYLMQLSVKPVTDLHKTEVHFTIKILFLQLILLSVASINAYGSSFRISKQHDRLFFFILGLYSFTSPHNIKGHVHVWKKLGTQETGSIPEFLENFDIWRGNFYL